MLDVLVVGTLFSEHNSRLTVYGSLLGRYTFREEGSGKPLTSGGESGAAAGSAGGWRFPRKGELTHHHRDGAETGEDKPGLMTQNNNKNIQFVVMERIPTPN